MPDSATYDFVVIGAGSAGCAAAAGLAGANAGSVAVVEAGPSDAHPFVKMPFSLIWLMGSRRDWRFKSPPQKALEQGDAPGTPRLAMRGLQNLWVAGASVMPSITSANTNAPSMMIGHRAGQMIAKDAA